MPIMGLRKQSQFGGSLKFEVSSFRWAEPSAEFSNVRLHTSGQPPHGTTTSGLRRAKQSQFARRGWFSLAARSWTCSAAAAMWSPAGASTSRSPVCERSSVRGGTTLRRCAASAAVSETRFRSEIADLAAASGSRLPSAVCRLPGVCVRFFSGAR